MNCPKCGSGRVDELEWTFRAGTLGLQCRECGYYKLPGAPRVQAGSGPGDKVSVRLPAGTEIVSRSSVLDSGRGKDG